MAVSIALRINGNLRETPADLSPETIFPIYSITKILTAICAFPGWCAPRLVASTAEEISRVFDALTTGQLLGMNTLSEMCTLVPLPGAQDSPMVLGGGMGLYSNAASRYGRNYNHGGGGPGYDLSATIYPETRIGRVAVAVFVNNSSGPRADAVEETLLTRILDPLTE